MGSVFDYTDYRKYLLDFYDEQKKRNKAFSYRYFAKRLGVNSSGLYKNIVDGRRSMSRSLILRFSQALKHSTREAEYFENMVLFNEAKTVDEKKLYFERMMKAHQSKAYRVDRSQYEYYDKWYYSAIREIFSFFRFKDNYEALARTLNPSIRPHEAKKAVSVLAKLGLIKKDSHGYYVQTDAAVTTGPEIQSLNVANFQRTTMDLAREALDRHPARLRDISTLTLSISQETFKAMKEEVVAFRRKLLSMEQKSDQRDRVYQLNFQIFPLTKVS